MIKARGVLPAVLAFLSVGLVAALKAQSYKSTFVKLGNGVPGVLYEPLAPGPKAEIAVLVMHTNVDYLTFLPCSELAKRGYRVLCGNTSTGKTGFRSDEDIDKMLPDVKLGVQYLRHYAGVKKIVVFGHSGGGGLMAAYQNIAENGVKVCQGPEKLLPCPNSLADLPAADGVMLIDSTVSQAVNSLLSIDPAVAGDEGGRVLNPDLDMFNPKNGYNPKGSTYSEEFKKKFWAAQRAREDHLIAKAQERLKLIESGKGDFTDDEPFLIVGDTPNGNQLFRQDISLWSHTRNAWPLLHPDGTITTQIVHSVRVPQGGGSVTPGYYNGSTMTTVRRFLSTFAVRSSSDFGYDASSLHGIDYRSSYADTPFSVEGISAPLLQMGMTGSNEFFEAETIREHARSADKTLAYVEGAVHTFTPCTKCAIAQGLPENHYGDTVKTLFDYIDGWLSKPGRFMAQ